jgi:predicted peptidase
MKINFTSHVKHFNNHRTIITLLLLFLAFTCSCIRDLTVAPYGPLFDDLAVLPKDTGGLHKAVTLSTAVPYGYYIYTPSGYDTANAAYPLLIFLHGAGEKGNSASNPTVLNLVLKNGPPFLIDSKKWAPTWPMIVVSPQCHDSWWNATKVHELIGLIVQNYRVNRRRVYMTGLSMGGYGTFTYIEAYSSRGAIAAAVPICGGGDPSQASNYMSTPLWAFHGEADGTVPVANSINMVQAINALNPAVRAKLTIYPKVGHDSWTITYDGTGMGAESKEYDPFDESIVEWFFKYTKQ